MGIKVKSRRIAGDFGRPAYPAASLSSPPGAPLNLQADSAKSDFLWHYGYLHREQRWRRPDFGVFQNQKIYTVYLDMRVSDDDKAPSWTLQYAVLQPPADPTGISIKVNGVPTPPYATLKQVPELTPEQAAACEGKMIVIAGIMTADGKLEQLSVKKTPDPQVNQVVTDALSNWTFQPSQVDGKPISLKIMIGVRLVAH